MLACLGLYVLTISGLRDIRDCLDLAWIPSFMKVACGLIDEWSPKETLFLPGELMLHRPTIVQQATNSLYTAVANALVDRSSKWH